jgi:hypothetical protein
MKAKLADLLFVTLLAITTCRVPASAAPLDDRVDGADARHFIDARLE